ncbi:MAG: hypothetical protein ACYC6V_02505 [Bacillota bacterium]
MAFTLTTRSLTAVNEGYRLGALQKQLAQLQRQNESLRLELAQAHSLEQIRAVATTKLQMKQPDHFRIASVTNAAAADAYGFRTDLPGGSRAVAKAAVAPAPNSALAAPDRGARSFVDIARRVFRWLTTVREARADGWE